MPGSWYRTIRPPAVTKWVGGSLLFLNLLASAASLWLLGENRRHYRERAEIQTLNLAEVIEEDVVATVKRGDLALLTVRDEVEHDPGRDRLAQFIHNQQKRSGVLRGLCVEDARGSVLQGTSNGFQGESSAVRELIRGQGPIGREDLVLSGPRQTALGDGWCLWLVRRWNHPDGTLGGVIVGELGLDQIQLALARIHVGAYGTTSLRASDFGLLARHPARYGPKLTIGSKAFTGTYLKAARSGQLSTQFTARSILDGETRTYTMQRVEPFGLFLIVGLAERDYLQPWRHQILFAVAAILIMAGLSLALGWQARSAWLRHIEGQQRLKAEEERYRLLAENASAVIWTLDPEGRLEYVSPSILRQRGWTAEEFKAISPRSLAISGELAKAIREWIAQAHQVPPGSQPFERELLEATVPCKDGRVIQVEVQWRIVWGEGGRLLGFQGVTRDITERKRMEAERESYIAELKDLKERLEHMAQHDHLTGLPNRFLFGDRLEQALVQARRRKGRFAVLFLDLDRFKAVNDTYGHEAGDALLMEASRRIQSCIRESDTLARQGGDEFTALLLDIQERESVLRVARSMVDALAEPFTLGPGTCSVGVSIGIAIYPEDGGSADALRSAADTAMYAVKQSGRNGFGFA